MVMGKTVQAQDFQWAKSIGGTVNADEVSEIAMDAAGNVYTTGYYNGTVDFDPGPGVFNYTAVAGWSNAYISKLDAQGNFVWAKSIGNSSRLHTGSITAGANGTVYICGGFAGTVDFDPGAGTFNLTANAIVGGLYNSFFIVKLDANGNFVWAKNFAGNGNISYFLLSDIAVDAAGNVFTTCGFKGTMDFDPGAGTYNLTATAVSGTVYGNIFISKLDAGGNFVWAKSVTGTNDVSVGSILVDSFGNVYSSGSFKGTGDFDPGAGTFNLTPASTYHNAYISKLDMNGNFVWAKSFQGTYSVCYSMTMDATGNIYTSGTFDGTVDFDPGSSTYNIAATPNNIFVSKLTANGNFIWAKNFGGSYHEMNGDAAGNVYMAGTFGTTVDFDPGPGVYNLTAIPGNNTGFISKLNASGNFEWARSFNDSNGFNAFRGISVNASGMVNMTGVFSKTMDFDLGPGVFNLTHTGYYDIFILQFNSCAASFASLSPSVCQSYTSPSARYTWTTSGTYSDTLTNASGCDSIITINLTLLDKPKFNFTTNSMVANFAIVGSACSTFVWDFGNGNTSTINPEPIVTYATPGTYGVCLQCNGQPSSCTQCYNITVPSNSSGTTGMVAVQSTSGFTIYPNPANHFITIEATGMQANEIFVLLNAMGQQILSGSMQETKTRIDIKDLPEGMYLVQVGGVVRKWMKQ
jgi:hypothetical protein